MVAAEPSAKQAQEVYLAGPLLPSFLHNTRWLIVRLQCNCWCSFLCSRPMSAEAALCVCWCQLIIMACSTDAAVCSIAPEWFWFGLLLLLLPFSLRAAVPSSLSRTYSSGFITILKSNYFFIIKYFLFLNNLFYYINLKFLYKI